MSMVETLSVTVAVPDAGERLDRLLAKNLTGLSRTQLKRLIEEGRLSSGGATISDPSMRVKPGQVFTLALPPPVSDRPEAQAMELVIPYEDEHLLVIDKPAGLVVHPAAGNPDHTLVNALLAHCGDSLAGIGGVKRPGIVHRLDKDTSGLMVVAKTDLAHRKLSADFAAHRIVRAYQAVVWGIPRPPAGEIEGAIGRSPINRKKMAMVTHGGKYALTRYRTLQPFADAAAWLECRLATGRTHQIRVHLSAQGHPLIGDPVYGSKRGPGRLRALPEAVAAALANFPRQALHAGLIGFEHPATGQVLQFVSGIPADMQNLIIGLETL